MTSNQDLIRAVAFAHSQVKKMAASDPDDIAPEINASLSDLFRHAKKLKFWHERLKSISEDVSVESLSQSVPILTRPEIQESSGLLRLRIPDTKKSDYYTSKTSGSTGQPVEVLKFKPSQQIQNGVISLLRREWGKLDVTKNYGRIRNGRDERASESWGFPYTLLGKTGKSFTMDMETRRASGVLNEILDKEISYIQANTTLLKALAFEAYSEGITESLGLQKGLTWAEKVTDEDRSVVRDYLGVEIWDSYSSEELGAIALQCPEHNHLHTLPFFTLIEIVDEDGRPCSVGEVGRVIATSLHNFAQPMIRYELGDLASFQDQCDALPGLPVINPEVTRVRDIYIDKNGVEYVPRFGKCRFVTYRGIRDYQVVVCSDAILFMYSATTKFLGNQELEISEDVGKQFGFDLPVQVQRIQDSEMFSHWKRKVFYRSNASHVEFQKPENLANLKGLLQGS